LIDLKRLLRGRKGTLDGREEANGRKSRCLYDGWWSSETEMTQ